MSFNLIDYYKLLNKDVDVTTFNPSGNDRRIWYINYNKRHSFKIFSDYDCLDEYAEKISLSNSDTTTSIINSFSDKLNQKLKNTKIITNHDGSESVDLELEDRIVTIVVDQSGSMTWNDANNFRYTIAKELIDKIDENYPGSVKYNLISFGGTLINVLFFGMIEEAGVDVTDLNSVAQVILADDDANFAGIRVMKSTTDYPCNYGGTDGDEVADGFIKNVIDTNVLEGITYYYKVFTYDKNLKMSKGVGIKVTPRERIIPRGVSVFRTAVESEDISTGSPYIGYGVSRDDNTIGIWHMNEGSGRHIYDFSDSNIVLEHSNELPSWVDPIHAVCGTSGLLLDGIDDYAVSSDFNNQSLVTFSSSDIDLTIMAWVCSYAHSSSLTIIHRGTNSATNYLFGIDANNKLFFTDSVTTITTSSLTLKNYEWQHVAFVRNGVDVTFYLDGVAETSSLAISAYTSSSTDYISVAANVNGSNKFIGKISEVSIHNTDRNSDYISKQLVEEFIYDQNNDKIGTEYVGIKEDNGDRLVVLKYEIPDDYNFINGSVRIVKNRKRLPSWEEDGSIIYDVSASPGVYYVSDPDDFVLGEKYYYRIFSKNVEGNFSFTSDSPSLTITIPISSISDYYSPLGGIIEPPTTPSGNVSSIVAGNKKIYLRWRNQFTSDLRIKRTKIYYSTINYPVVNFYGISGDELAYTSFSDESINTVFESIETGFVHRNLLNNKTYYYTIVFIDKYGRVSGYDGVNDQQADFYQLSATPSIDADESVIPLSEVENLRYEIITEDSVSVQWDQAQRNPVDINTYFDQTVLLYSSLTDNFGVPISSDTIIKMSIKSDILKEDQSENVFGGGPTKSFVDRDAYEFFVDKNDDGVIKATLKMTSDLDIISQIKEASFTVSLKAYLPKEKVESITTSSTGSSIQSLENYEQAVESTIAEIEGTSTETISSENIFEYYSSSIVVKFTNPWEVELINRDNRKVFEICYKQETDPETKEKYLVEEEVPFNGIYMKADAPFIARCKVKYKGLSIDSGTVDVAIWDADFSNLCAGEGKKTSISTTVIPPSNQVQIKIGSEQTINSLGEEVLTSISYTDVPLYAPDKPHAVQLFVKASRSGYSSIKSMYVFFQSILKISQHLQSPKIDGKDVEEMKSLVFLINPNYPNYKTNQYDSSLVTYPIDNTIVEWKITSIEGNKNRQIYSIDKVPKINGIFSYTRKGVARNVFLGPIEAGNETIRESHEITSSVVYQGLTALAKRYIYLEYSPEESKQYESKFLMEVDGGYGLNGIWKTASWANVGGFPMWSDGKDFRRVKISRNPAVSSFDWASCFRDCAEQKGLSVLELSSGQIVHIVTGDSSIDVIHGEVTEEIDPYTGEAYLVVGENGSIDSGEAYVELEDSSVSDTTYFYIRSSSFISQNGYISSDSTTLGETPVNDCLCLKPDDGLFKQDLPTWSPIIYISGTTTVFVDNRSLVLSGGGNFYTGIPPCPISIQEPLSIETVWRKVIHYYYPDSNPSVMASQEIEVGDNRFLDSDGNSYIKYNSDVIIRVKILWRGEPVPEGTPVYVSIGNNNILTLFIADRNIYYTSIDSEEGYSYVDVTIRATRVTTQSTTETVEIYATYDKNEQTDRKKGQLYYLTMENISAPIIEPEEGVIPDDIGSVVEPETPYSKTMDRYNILTDTWDTVANLSERKGNMFSGVVNNTIYVMGGVKNNSLDISNKTESYNSISDEWDTHTHMVTPRFGGMTIVYDDKIYTIGGIGIDSYNRKIGVSGNVEVYYPSSDPSINLLSDSWEELSHMPVIDDGKSFENSLGIAFGSASLIFINSKPYIYIIGGINQIIIEGSSFSIKKYNDRILRYSIKDNLWEYSPVLRSDELLYYKRISPLSITYNDQLIVFGGAIEGSSEFILYPESFYIDIEEDFTKEVSERWITIGNQYITNFPMPKFQSAMVGYGINPSINDESGIYYILGGADKNMSSLDVIEKISTEGSIFTYDYSYGEDVSQSLSPLLTAKHGASAVLSYSSDYTTPYIYLIGGYTEAKEIDHVDIEFDI